MISYITYIMGNINYIIEPGLHKAAKYKALELNITLKELIEESIKQFVEYTKEGKKG